MKPFNLEAAKRGEPVVQRCGRAARYVGEREHNEIAYKYVFEIETAAGHWALVQGNGSGFLYGQLEDAYLLMAPRKEKRWIVSWVYEGLFCACGWGSESAAYSHKSYVENLSGTNITITEVEVEI